MGLMPWFFPPCMIMVFLEGEIMASSNGQVAARGSPRHRSSSFWYAMFLGYLFHVLEANQVGFANKATLCQERVSLVGSSADRRGLLRGALPLVCGLVGVARVRRYTSGVFVVFSFNTCSYCGGCVWSASRSFFLRSVTFSSWSYWSIPCCAISCFFTCECSWSVLAYPVFRCVRSRVFINMEFSFSVCVLRVFILFR